MNYRIPKTLDNSMRCLGIPLDTLIVFMMVWSSFVMFNLGLYGIPVGVLMANIFSRFRSRAIIRKVIRFIYWYLPSEMNFISGVQGHHRQLTMKLNSRIKLVNLVASTSIDPALVLAEKSFKKLSDRNE